MKDNKEIKDTRTGVRGNLKRRFLINKASELVWQERHKNEIPVLPLLFSAIGKPGQDKLIQVLLPRPPLIASTEMPRHFITFKQLISPV